MAERFNAPVYPVIVNCLRGYDLYAGSNPATRTKKNIYMITDKEIEEAAEKSYPFPHHIKHIWSEGASWSRDQHKAEIDADVKLLQCKVNEFETEHRRVNHLLLQREAEIKELKAVAEALLVYLDAGSKEQRREASIIAKAALDRAGIKYRKES